MKSAIVIPAVVIKIAAILAMFFLSGCKAGEGNVAIVQSQSPIFAPAPGSPITGVSEPGNVAMGDVNQDGSADLVVASGQGRSITVLLGQGGGQFRAAGSSPVAVPEDPHEMILGDINGDSKLDLALASHNRYNVTLLLGDGSGGFAPAPNSPVRMKDGQHPHTHGLAVGDLNGDKIPDLVTANNEDNDIAVVFGDGRSDFARAPGSPFAVGQSPYPIGLGDLNGDGSLDIAATNTLHGNGQSSQALTLLFNDGRGGFRGSQVLTRTVDPWYVAIGDVNGDFKADLVTTHWERSELTVLAGDGEGSFTEIAGSPFDLGHAAWWVVIADMDGDGKADVAAAAGDGVRVMLGDGQGSYKAAPGSPFRTGKGAWRLAAGDVNGDGKLDVVTSDLESNSVTVLLAQY